MTLLRFTKMQGAGNDFVVIDAVASPVHLSRDQVRRLADRRFGVGADQILVVEPSGDPQIDFRYRIFNADGGEVEQCGNGARCFVRFVVDRGLTTKRRIRVVTLGGIIEPELLDDGQVRVNMGPPRFEPADVHFNASALTTDRRGSATRWHLPCPDAQALAALRMAPGSDLAVGLVSMGNPHAVTVVPDLGSAGIVDVLGPWLERHARFAQGVNAGFLEVLDRHHARLRVWERGAGETLACGTGACAAAVSAIRQDLLATPVHLDVNGGRLRVDWDGLDDPGADVWLSGPAQTVFEGQIDLP